VLLAALHVVSPAALFGAFAMPIRTVEFVRRPRSPVEPATPAEPAAVHDSRRALRHDRVHRAVAP
jgi:hypothetical protein